MGIFLKPSNNVYISIMQLESGSNKIWVDKVLNGIIQRIPD
jgi:hypothetical protein